MITFTSPITINGAEVAGVQLTVVADAEDARRCVAHFVGARRGLLLWAGDDYPPDWTAEDRDARVLALRDLIPQCWDATKTSPVDYRTP